MKSVDSKEVDLFLSHHASIEARAHFYSGELFGNWRITAFLDRGGSGEVYRVVNSQNAAVAALKVFAWKLDGNNASDGVARKRFENEMRFLSNVKYISFPRFIAQGEKEGRPWYVMELLEDRNLPSDDAGAADFIVKISKCVQLLHSIGYVHRDIKPGNIMYRHDGTPVLVDMGLLKRLDSGNVIVGNDSALSVVDGKAVGVGTPRYAAPEQFIGGEISPAADIHALGMLINECFKGELKGCWERIVACATSSIPERRYRNVLEFIGAVRRRHWRRIASVFCGILLAAGIFAISLLPWWNDVGRERWIWWALKENISTNVVVKKEMIVKEFATTSAGTRYPSKWHWRFETNTVDVTLIRLDGRTFKFKNPLRLSSARETWIVGPGVIDAAIECDEDGVKVRLENCLFNNRSKTLPSKSKIRYDLAGGVYLNFTEHEDDVRWQDCVEPFNGEHNAVRFKGPETIEDYNCLRQKECVHDL